MVAVKYYIPGDIVVLDAGNQPVALVEVKAVHSSDAEVVSAERQILEALGLSPLSIPFALFVDLDRIRIYKTSKGSLHHLLSLVTRDVLSMYEPKFEDIEIYEYYLTGLVDAWL